jgi:hypothetical protein
MEFFLFYLMEIITVLHRTLTRESEEESYMKSNEYFTIITVQASANVILAIILTAIIAIDYTRKLHWEMTPILRTERLKESYIAIGLCLIPYILMILLELLRTFRDEEIIVNGIRLVLDLFGYYVLMVSWVLVGFCFEKTNKVFVIVLFVVHVAFQMEIVLGNLMHEAITTFKSDNIGYLISVVENIYLFEILHLAILGVWHNANSHDEETSRLINSRLVDIKVQKFYQ